jgi:hypothetical protein
MIVAGAQYTTGRPSGLYTRCYLLLVTPEGLLTQYMSPRLQGGDTDLGEHIVRRRHDNEVRRRIPYYCAPVRACHGPVFGGKGRRRGFIYVADSDQPGAIVRGDCGGALATDTAGTNKQHAVFLGTHGLIRRTV